MMKSKHLNPNKLKISVIMPVYNQEKFIKKSLESILNQTYRNLEFLIVDDCSTDNTLKIIKSYKDKRIILYKNKTRRGISKNLNFLANQAEADYIARMDGDDIACKNRFEEQVNFFKKHKTAVLVGTWAKIINKDNKIIGDIQYPTQYEDIKKVILSYNPFIHPSVMFKSNIFQKLGGYDENLTYSQDYDLFLKIAAKYPCHNIKKYLFKFRWNPDFKKQKIQHKLALKIRLKAVSSYGYNIFEIIKIIKPLILYFLPLRLKKEYWQKHFN